MDISELMLGHIFTKKNDTPLDLFVGVKSLHDSSYTESTTPLLTLGMLSHLAVS